MKKKDKKSSKTRLIQHPTEGPTDRASLRPGEDDNFAGGEKTELDEPRPPQGQVREVEISGRRPIDNDDVTRQQNSFEDFTDDEWEEANNQSDDEGEVEKTKLITPINQVKSSTEDNSEMITEADKLPDPPVGCLLIIDGPGVGELCTIGVGHNTIGRGGTNRIVLDFGDKTISSGKALSVFYEHKANQFFVSPGEGSNLAYFVENQQAIMGITQLLGGEEINLGETTFKFFPFCSSEWTWESVVTQES